MHRSGRENGRDSSVVGFSDWRRLVDTYLRPHRRVVAVLAAALFTTIALQVATPQIVRVFLDRATDPDGGAIGTLTVVYIAAVLLQQGFRVLTSWLSGQVGWLATNELRADLMAHCLELDPSFHEAHTPGELIERVDGDLNGLSHFFAEFLLNVIGNLLLLVAVLVVIAFQSVEAGLALGGVALVSLLVLVAVRRVAAPYWERSRESSAQLFGFLEERLAGAQDVRTAGAEAETLRGFYARARDRLWRISRARQVDAVPWATHAVIAAVIIVASFVAPAVLVRRGDLTVGGAFALYFYTQLLLQPLNNVGHQVEQLQQAVAGGRRVIALLGVRSELVDGDGAPLPAGPLDVELDAVTFGYGDDPDVLHDVTIHLPAGKILGLVGRTGSGKSSIARLLVRFHDPRAGVVRVGGTDVRDQRRADLRDRVTMVTQDVHVLRASVRDNLTLFDDRVPDALVLEAIERLGLGPWLRGLDDGLHTVIAETGAGMSAGEAQLLSFGRAFLRNPSVVILDEASSRLDPATEAVLEDAVGELLRGRTGIVIAHRLATLDRCDLICVLDRGRVVELGPRDELASDPTTRFSALLRAGLDAVA